MTSRIAKVMLMLGTAALMAGCVHIDVDKTEKTTARAIQSAPGADEQAGD